MPWRLTLLPLELRGSFSHKQVFLFLTKFNRSGIALQLDLLSTLVKANLLTVDSVVELFPRWSPNYMPSSNLEEDVQIFGQSVEVGPAWYHISTSLKAYPA
jgi:hypothetical protein